MMIISWFLAAFVAFVPNFTAAVVTPAGNTFGSTAFLTPTLALTAQHVAGKELDIAFIQCGPEVLPGVVIKSSIAVDLALVQLLRPCTAVDSIRILTEDPPENAELTIQGYPAGGPRKTTHASVAGYEKITYEDGYSRFVMMLDGRVTGGNSGGPVIYEGGLAGIVSAGLCYSKSACYGAAIPASVIQNFLGM